MPPGRVPRRPWRVSRSPGRMSRVGLHAAGQARRDARPDGSHASSVVRAPSDSSPASASWSSSSASAELVERAMNWRYSGLLGPNMARTISRLRTSTSLPVMVASLRAAQAPASAGRASAQLVRQPLVGAMCDEVRVIRLSHNWRRKGRRSAGVGLRRLRYVSSSASSHHPNSSRSDAVLAYCQRSQVVGEPSMPGSSECSSAGKWWSAASSWTSSRLRLAS